MKAEEIERNRRLNEFEAEHFEKYLLESSKLTGYSPEQLLEFFAQRKILVWTNTEGLTPIEMAYFYFEDGENNDYLKTDVNIYFNNKDKV